MTGRPVKLYLMLLFSSHRYWIFRSWGRVGTVIGSNKLEQMPSKEDAIEHFMKLYEEKTGNAWHSKTFTKHPKKFYPLEIDYGQVIMLRHLLVLVKGFLLKTCHESDDIIDEFHQIFKQLILVLRKLFQKTDEEGTLFNSLYKASILITKDG